MKTLEFWSKGGQSFAKSLGEPPSKFAGLLDHSISSDTPSNNTSAANMAPKKKVERAAQENISLGPQVREGEFLT